MSDNFPIQIIPADEGQPIVGGVKCKASSASTGDAYTILELTLPAGGGAPLHVHHREDEIFHVIDGVCNVIYDGKTHRAEAGTIVILPKNTPHAFKNPAETPTRILITAVPGGLDRYFAELAAITGDDPDASQKVAAINAKYEIVF